MSLSKLFIAALLTAPMAAFAQGQSAPDPADAAAPAAGIAYASAFASYRAFADGEQTPDKGWRNANRLVGQLGGHAGNLAPAPGDTARRPSPQPQAAPAGKHHGMHCMVCTEEPR